MALGLHDLTLGERRHRLVDTLRGYLARYRLPLYLLSGAAVALGFALNWNWLTAAGLVRIVAVLPCALMIFSCVRHGTGVPAQETASQDTTSPSRFPASGNSQL
jgi:peptidoglycan/LPS O-acetylase OafA/YrhL